jgi:aminoglycoside 6'-N-acetyltransferase I
MNQHDGGTIEELSPRLFDDWIVARRLCNAVEKWASEKGCSEFASDTEIDNAVSERMHLAPGFQETDLVVCFRKQISGPEF